MTLARRLLRPLLAALLALGLVASVQAPAAAADGDTVRGYVHVSRQSITANPYAPITLALAVPGCGRDVAVQRNVGGTWRTQDSLFLFDPATADDCRSVREVIDLNDHLTESGPLKPGTHSFRFVTAAESDFYGPNADYVDITEAVSPTITVKVSKGVTSFPGWPAGTWYVKKGGDLATVKLRVGWPGEGNAVQLQRRTSTGRWETIGSKYATSGEAVSVNVTADNIRSTMVMRLRVAGDGYVTGAVSEPLVVKAGNAPSVKGTLSKKSQVFGKTPAKLTVTVGSRASGTAAVYSGSTKVGTVKVSKGRGVLTIPKTLKVGAHSLSIRYTPSKGSAFKPALAPMLSFTVKKG